MYTVRSSALIIRATFWTLRFSPQISVESNPIGFKFGENVFHYVEHKFRKFDDEWKPECGMRINESEYAKHLFFIMGPNSGHPLFARWTLAFERMMVQLCSQHRNYFSRQISPREERFAVRFARRKRQR